MTYLKNKHFPITAGLDVHKNVIVCVILGAKDKTIKAKFARNLEGIRLLIEHLKQHGCEQVVMESTGPYYRILYDQLSAAGLNPHLVNALDNSNKGKIKTDFRDAERLARKFIAGEVKPSYVPKSPIKELRKLVRRRMKLVTIRTMLKNLVRAELDELVIPIDNLFSSLGKKARELLLTLTTSGDMEGLLSKYPALREKMEAIERLVNTKIPEESALIISVLVKLMMEIDEAIKEIDRALRQIVIRNKKLLRSVELLMTIPGVGFIAAVTIIAEIGEISRFPSPKSLAMYAGLCPRIFQSGGRIYHGPLPWRCNKRLRWIMYQVAIALLRTRSQLKRFYERIKRRRGHKVAVIALARKIIVAIWCMLTRDEEWREGIKSPRRVPRVMVEKETVLRAINLLRSLGYIVVKGGEGNVF